MHVEWWSVVIEVLVTPAKAVASLEAVDGAMDVSSNVVAMVVLAVVVVEGAVEGSSVVVALGFFLALGLTKASS